jgi:hypothetical protein
MNARTGVGVFAMIALVSGGIGASLDAGQRPDAERIKRQFVGSFKLISYVSYDQNGAESRVPYSVGQISYDAAGRMSAQLMGDNREPVPAGRGQGQAQAQGQTQAQGQAAAGQGQGQGRGQGQGQGRGQASEAQRAALYSTYIAYFGRYEVDVDKGIVMHIVEGSINPGMVGSPMPRYFEWSPDGNTLYLQTKTGDRVTGRLRWDRHK